MGERKVTINNHVVPTHNKVNVVVLLDYLKNSPGVVVDMTPADATDLAIRLLRAAETVRDRQRRAESYTSRAIARLNGGRGE